MPFMNYAIMSDDDTKALVAFLRTIKPINKVVAPNKDLKMPKGPPPNLEQLKAARTSGDATSDEPLKHGSYLASIMLCNHCHWTPGKDFMPAGPDKMFSGGLPIEIPMLGKGTIFTRNITSDPETGIGKWTEDQIFTAIKTMTKPDGKMIQGPMLFLQGTWSQLDDKDLHAVAAFIKKLPPVKNKVPPSTFKPNPPPGADKH
jgi:cytochrome c553